MAPRRAAFDLKTSIDTKQVVILTLFRSSIVFNQTLRDNLSVDEVAFETEKIKQLSAEIENENNRRRHDIVEQEALNIMQEIRDNPYLQVLAKEGYLQARFSDDVCGGPACVTFDAYAVTFSPKDLKRLYRQVGPQRFKTTLAAIVGHEVGHYVAEIIFFLNNDSSEVKAYRANPLKYHLLVDGIGMKLMNYSVKDFVGALSIYRGLGDISARFNCLRTFR